LAPQGFAPIDPTAYRATACTRGQVRGVDAMICEYGDSASLKQAKQMLQDQWMQQDIMTAVAVQQGHTLLAVSDVSQADRSTKTIAKLVDAFKQL
jgi:hypothetical protein